MSALLSPEDLKIIMDEIAQAGKICGRHDSGRYTIPVTALDKYNALKEQKRRLIIVADLLKENMKR